MDRQMNSRWPDELTAFCCLGKAVKELIENPLLGEQKQVTLNFVRFWIPA